MLRRSKAGSVKSRRRKPAAPKRASGAEVARSRSSSAASEGPEFAQLARERDEALEREKAAADVLRVISSSPGELQPVFQTILENATRICEARFGTLFQFDGKNFHTVAQFGTPPELMQFQKQRGPFEPAGNAFRRLMRSKELTHTIDAAAEDAASPAVRHGGARSMIHVPIVKQDTLLGAIIMYRQKVRPFSDKQIELVKNFASQAVIAIENARLLNELRQSLEQQTATAQVLSVISSSPGELELVFEAMLTNATRLCEAKFGILYFYDEGRLRLGATHDVPPAFIEARGKEPFTPAPDASTGKVVATKRAVQIADLAATQSYSDRNPVVVPAVEAGGVRTALSVPMLKENSLVGVITIYRKEVRPFTDKQIALVANFASQAVIAIENARLLNELRESLDHQTATADILRVIAGTPEDSKRALNTIAETAVRMFDANSVNIRRIEGDVLRIIAAAGPMAPRLREALPDIPLEPTDPSVRCFLDNRQNAIEDRRVALASERGKIARVVRDIRIGSQAFTPLSRQGKAIGVMIVARTEVRPFQQSELDLMTGFADQAVIAIENARLLSELRESYRLVQQQAGKLEDQSQELLKLNQQLEQRVADQVGEIERMGRLRRFLPPQVADLIVASGTEKQLESHRREITALFCDLRGFTGFSESSDPEDVMALLRDYHAAIGEIVVKYGGTLERFAGDGVMVIFNDPVPVENPALQAVLMALDMRTAIGGLIEKWRDLGHDLGFGIGIAHGFATLGTIGFEGRFDYAAIGTVSNVASRLCDEAKPGQILISPRVRQAVEKGVTVEPVGEFALKGIRRPMAAYNVLAPSTSKPQ
jgi:class 3 adenylate cyclase/putative methionine-R-sulfoxide reductase with GAF domain